jgi:hypothetical protein
MYIFRNKVYEMYKVMFVKGFKKTDRVNIIIIIIYIGIEESEGIQHPQMKDRLKQ